MELLILIIAGLMLPLTMFVVMWRIDIQKFLGYSTFVDVFFTILMFIMFAHTFSGVVAGSFAGLVMAIGLSLLRKVLGYKKFKLTRCGPVWEVFAPTWTASTFVGSFKDKCNVRF